MAVSPTATAAVGGAIDISSLYVGWERVSRSRMTYGLPQVGDNHCGYAPAGLPPAAKAFPSGSCRQVNEHIQGGQLSDEHAALLTEYRRHHDLVFVPGVLDSYYASAAKLKAFYRCVRIACLLRCWQFGGSGGYPWCCNAARPPEDLWFLEWE